MDTYIYMNELWQEALDKNLIVTDTLTFTCGVVPTLVNFVVSPFSITRDTIPVGWNDLTQDQQTCVTNEISSLVNSTGILNTKVWNYECLSVNDLYELFNNETIYEYEIFQWQDSSKVEIIYR